jgi:bifunctional enzyme CysN/CysC
MAGGGIVFARAEAAPVSKEIRAQEAGVAVSERERLKGHRGAVLWMTGLSGSGKSTIAAALERALALEGVHSFQLDGDNLRFGLNRDLGFSEDDRKENMRRAGEVALLFAESATVVIASLISPFREDRQRVREAARLRGLPFLEVHLDAPLEVCERRDPKGLYAKARRGEITQFTGISSPYEPPLNPEIRLESGQAVEKAVEGLLDKLMPLIRLKARAEAR